MNPYKRIARLESKIEKLTAENESLKQQLIRQGVYDKNMKAASKAEDEFYKLSSELEEQKAQYDDVMKALFEMQKDFTKAYKKVMKEV